MQLVVLHLCHTAAELCAIFVTLRGQALHSCHTTAELCVTFVSLKVPLEGVEPLLKYLKLADEAYYRQVNHTNYAFAYHVYHCYIV
jgi:hypothetical protein